MMDPLHITSVRFQRYKAFRDYSVTLHSFNVLVGPNNSGKSTVLGAFRILAEAMRRARARNPTLIPGPQGETRGYAVDFSDVGVATENIFFDYDDSLPAAVRFKVSNGNELMLHFPAEAECYLICRTKSSLVTSTTSFLR